MLDRALQEHLGELRAYPGDLQHWIDLIYHLRRLRLAPQRLELLPLLPGLIDARTSKKARVKVDRILLDLYGVQVMKGPRKYPPEFWLRTERMDLEGDIARDTVTRLPLHLRRIRDRSLMALIPSGTARLGRERPGPEEVAERMVEIDTFYLDVKPVSGAHLRKFFAYRPRGRPLYSYSSGARNAATIDKFPAQEVSWEDAAAYAEWAGGRLPTEDEWERAARMDPPEYMSSPQQRVLVGQDGVFGNHGMLRPPGEWCADWLTDEAGGERVVRGHSGAPGVPAEWLATTPDPGGYPNAPWIRRGFRPEIPRTDVGFRLAMSF